MSQPESAVAQGRGRRASGCFLGVVGLVIFFFLMMAGIGVGLLELGWTLLFGWTAFISRVVPKISWDWGAVITSVLFAGLVGILAHYFLAWVTRGITAARGASFQWQSKWTICGLLLGAFCFLIGMSVAGAAHQIGWIIGARESLFEDRYAMHRFVEVNRVEVTISRALSAANTLPELRKNLSAQLMESDGRRPALHLESVRLLVSVSPSNTIDGVLILGRDKGFEMRYGASYVTANDSSPIAAKDLGSFIQRNATNLVAF